MVVYILGFVVVCLMVFLIGGAIALAALSRKPKLASPVAESSQEKTAPCAVQHVQRAEPMTSYWPSPPALTHRQQQLQDKLQEIQFAFRVASDKKFREEAIAEFKSLVLDPTEAKISL